MDRKQLDQALDGLTASLNGLTGLRAAAVLYGSAARGDWIPGRSDVNVLLLVDDTTPAELQRLTPAVTEWHRRGFAPPLIMGREEWARSADVFPIEITDMQLSHRMLCGVDPVQGVVVDPADLREAVEKELRGKLVRLRQAYVRFGDNGAILGGFAIASISTYFALLRCTAILLRRSPGASSAETAASFSTDLGAETSVAVQIAGHRAQKEWHCAPDTFVRYLELVRRTVDLVDNFNTGDR